MTRLGAIIAGFDRSDGERDDVSRLCAAIPEIAALPPGLVRRMWEEFSEDQYCASSLILHDDAIVHFGEWLRDDFEAPR